MAAAVIWNHWPLSHRHVNKLPIVLAQKKMQREGLASSYIVGNGAGDLSSNFDKPRQKASKSKCTIAEDEEHIPEKMNVVWLKRDVRLLDHEPLALAARSSLPVLLLYVYERCHMESEVYHEAHHNFINDGLVDLDTKVRTLAGNDANGLTLRVGNVVDVLSEIHACVPIQEIFSHHEVGNHISTERNERVAKWADAHGVRWTQCRQDGVSDVRHEKLDKGSWAKKWTGQMTRSQFSAPTKLQVISSRVIKPGAIADARACGVKHLGERLGAQRGGETHGNAILHSFLDQRGEGYCEEMSSPLTGWDSCSRLSPYLAWGHISLRSVFQALTQRQNELREKKSGTGRWLKSLAALGARLRWRSHFQQKLHDDPSIEKENMCRMYDALRKEFDTTKFDAWVEGRTGYPMVDACMRSLNFSGWINFRMRAMLVSFACYQLWLDWRPLTPVLARLFLDYEPGIHYPQFQMQAGTTGINANRIYSATKQAQDNAGPDYEFIRRWVPELKDVPTKYVPEPHKMPAAVQRACSCIIGEHYPPPIVDHNETYRHARSEFARLRGRAETKSQASAVFEKHGSRKKPTATVRRPAKATSGKQRLATAAANEKVVTQSAAPLLRSRAKSKIIRISRKVAAAEPSAASADALAMADLDEEEIQLARAVKTSQQEAEREARLEAQEKEDYQKALAKSLEHTS